MAYVLIFCLIVAIISFSIFVIMDIFGGKYILDIEDLPMDCDTVIILGAGVRADGNPCDLLADRLDNSGESYNELAVMKKWIMKNYTRTNIKEEDLLVDNCGFCTYDSMKRAKNIFNIKKAIISTNEYHLPRAIFIARSFGIEAYGIASDMRQYDKMKKYKIRERVAQLKDFFLCLIKMQ